MGFQYAEVWIEGTMPLLMACFGDEAAEGVPGGSGKGTRPAITAAVKETPREQAEKLAIRIYEYQRAYPQRPVFLVGHSGGSGVAVFALESLSRLRDARPVDGAILIASSVSRFANPITP